MEYNVSQSTSNVIHTFFEGEITELTRDKIKDIYNDPKNYKKVNETIYKELLKIIRMREDKKKDYRIIVKEPDIESEDSGGEDYEDSEEGEDEEDSGEIKNYILSQRKAYVKWINETFYPSLIESKDEDEILKVYQRFVKQYLSINTPYRGLLVYHGLGTGKSATAISTAEGLSNSIPITTLLPASLETEFIKEIKLWGDTYFNVKHNNWIFYEFKTIQSDMKLRKLINDKYKITLDNIKNISTRSRNMTKDKYMGTGFWLISNNIDDDEFIIKTVPSKDGKSYIKRNGEDTNIVCQKLSENEVVFINEQITKIIKLKYNFIHYNPLPSVKLEKKDKYTDNDKITIKLLRKLKINKKNFIDSPFDEEVIVIDEVHNFVREIYNNSGASRQYYEWILNAKNLKLITLSGTPIINRPSEIAILCNMLKGIIKTYTFVINKKVDLNIIDKQFREIFYTDNSPVEQYYYRKKDGKFLITFIKNKTNFESLRNEEQDIIYTLKYEEQTFKEFINYIYKGLNKLFKDHIIPSKKDLLKKEKDILNGKQVKFDVETDTIFNIDQKLFEIYKNDGTVIDLTDNENFMEYFFNTDEDTIKLSKRILLKRMLMGLISFYPIDRSAIKNMPEVTKPNNKYHNDYMISKKINVVLCPISYKQFIKYEEVWKDAKLKSLKQNMFGNDEQNENFDYHIRTRQTCNIVYENDEFRKIKKTQENKLLIEDMKQKEYQLLKDSGILKINSGLKIISPKFNSILNNIQKYIDTDGSPTGKILYYSEFRSDSGSEIFEQILQANGYQKYDGETDLTDTKRYTFITGKESEQERKRNKEAFNDKNNIIGNKIQIMIISGAGAEGISLTCVRQVHIMEPYWNFVRIDQVFGRAIRMGSHKDLEPKDRNVEEYLYLSSFPEGSGIKEVYQTIKELGTWLKPDQILHSNEDIVNILFTKHKELYSNIQKLIKLKVDTKDKTADQLLFDTMEKKFVISQEIIRVIQEASVDCIQNTRDNVVLNDNCIRYDDKLLSEDAYFPGIDDTEIQKIDKKQLSETFKFFIKPNIYVISAVEDGKNIFVYYKTDPDKDLDIRYIRENGILLGSVDSGSGYYYSYDIKEDLLSDKLGNKFSVYQNIYSIPESILTNILNSKIFPEPDKINDLFGYKIKHNSTELFFFYKHDNKPIVRLYEYDVSEKVNFNIKHITPIIIDKNILFKIK